MWQTLAYSGTACIAQPWIALAMVSFMSPLQASFFRRVAAAWLCTHCSILSGPPAGYVTYSTTNRNRIRSVTGTSNTSDNHANAKQLLARTLEQLDKSQAVVGLHA